jgi:hypothetical protein
MNETAPLVRVWDPLVRVGHWILVIAFFVAYFTEDDLLGVHVWAGYVVCIVLVVRILWGLSVRAMHGSRILFALHRMFSRTCAVLSFFGRLGISAIVQAAGRWSLPFCSLLPRPL